MSSRRRNEELSYPATDVDDLEIWLCIILNSRHFSNWKYRVLSAEPQVIIRSVDGACLLAKLNAIPIPGLAGVRQINSRQDFFDAFHGGKLLWKTTPPESRDGMMFFQASYKGVIWQLKRS